MEAVGCSKSTVSRRFIQESGLRLEDFLTRPIPNDLAAVMLDGIRLGDVLVVVAVGIDSQGAKHALSLQEGSTENASTVKLLLEDLVRRGMNVERKLLFVVDGGKALAAAIKDQCGARHPIQRCRVHKLRNVLEKIPKAKKSYVRAAMSAAWKLPFKHGIQKMKELARELDVSHWEASRSLLEGLEQTFTVNQLELPPLLIRSLGSTNVIENAHGCIRSATRRISTFQKPEDAKRWAATILAEAQGRFTILQGYKDIWILQVALEHPVERPQPLEKQKAS
jgi:putative transposase